MAIIAADGLGVLYPYKAPCPVEVQYNTVKYLSALIPLKWIAAYAECVQFISIKCVLHFMNIDFQRPPPLIRLCAGCRYFILHWQICRWIGVFDTQCAPAPSDSCQFIQVDCWAELSWAVLRVYSAPAGSQFISCSYFAFAANGRKDNMNAAHSACAPRDADEESSLLATP